jgi:hypothetical protein
MTLQEEIPLKKCNKGQLAVFWRTGCRALASSWAITMAQGGSVSGSVIGEPEAREHLLLDVFY